MSRRVALVSGGGRGIGRAVCLALAADGFDVAVNYRRDDEAARLTAADVGALGGRATLHPASVEDPEADAAMVEEIVREHGRLDALVHCAGIASRGHDVADTDPAEPARVMGVHAFAAHHLCRLVVPHLRAQERGDIVLISSIVAQHTRPGTAPYTMAKAALEMLAVTLAMEERAHGVRVNTVAPGLVATDMGDRLVRATRGKDKASDLDQEAPFGRVCRPEDVANVAAFLVSERGGYVTGQRLTVDGGETWGPWGTRAPIEKEGF